MKNLNLIILLFSFINCGNKKSDDIQSIDFVDKIKSNPYVECNGEIKKNFTENYNTPIGLSVKHEIKNNPISENLDVWVEQTIDFWNKKQLEIDTDCAYLSLEQLKVNFCDETIVKDTKDTEANGWYFEKYNEISISYDNNFDFMIKYTFIHEISHAIFTKCTKRNIQEQHRIFFVDKLCELSEGSC